MSQFLKTLSIAALVAIAGPALSQEGETAAGDSQDTGQVETQDTGQTQDGADAAPAGTGDLNMGAPAQGEEAQEGPGSTYVEESFGDWQQRCVRAEEGADPCQLYQLLRDADGNAVAEMSIFPLPAGRQAAAGSTIVTPLETLLPEAITISVDGGQAKRYPFEFCARQGCISRVGFTEAEVNQFRRGAAGRMVIVPAAAPDQQIDLTISLSGFTAGLDAVREANAQE